MISNRILREWRKEALLNREPSNIDSIENPDPDTITKVSTWKELHDRIIRLTQELMDINLIKGGK